jgi:hypothetical protein
MFKKEDENIVFQWFLRSPSQHGLRGGPGRLPDPKAFQNGAPDMGFLLFGDLAFTFFGDTFEIFRVIHE